MKEICFTFRKVPFYFISHYRNATKLKIGDSVHFVFIPRIYFNKNGTLKENMNLDWYFRKYDVNHKVDLCLKNNRKIEE